MLPVWPERPPRADRRPCPFRNLDMPASKTVLVLAGSARAIAASLQAAGREVRCFDWFGDVDTPCVTRVRDSTAAAAIARQPSGQPLVYGGAMENRPSLLERIAERRPVWGASPASLRVLRRDFRRIVAEADGRLPPESDDLAAAEIATGGWLWKPHATAAGRGIGPHRPGRPGRWQRRIDGDSIGAAFFASPPGATTPRVRSLGIVRHHRHPAARDTEPFALMDLTHDPAEAVPDELRQLAVALAAACDLRGPFNLDAIRGTDGRCTVLECNPRYTAGMELIERAAGRSVWSDDWPARSDRSTRPANRSPVHGKRVVLAGAALQSQLLPGDGCADVPRPQTRIEPGQPWCSVLATGCNIDDCRRSLDDAESRLRRLQAERS